LEVRFPLAHMHTHCIFIIRSVITKYSYKFKTFLILCKAWQKTVIRLVARSNYMYIFFSETATFNNYNRYNHNISRKKK
jgi:hypothetical protein